MSSPGPLETRTYNLGEETEEAMARKKQEAQEAETIGGRVARLRREKGLTQIELAERLGVAQSVVSDYERGALRLHGELILELAEVFGATPNEILGAEKGQVRDPSPGNRRLARRLQALDQLPKRDQEALLRTIDAFLAKAS